LEKRGFGIKGWGSGTPGAHSLTFGKEPIDEQKVFKRKLIGSKTSD